MGQTQRTMDGPTLRKSRTEEPQLAAPQHEDPSSGLSWLQTFFQYLASSRAEIRPSVGANTPERVSAYFQAQSGNLSAAFAARKARLNALQQRSSEWWSSSKWHCSMETPVDLSFLPPWRYVWDELKHVVFLCVLSGAVLYWFPYLFALMVALFVNLSYFASRIYLSDRPRLTFNPANPQTASILSKCPMIYRKFFPTIWAFGAKVQTGMFAMWPFPF